LVVEKIELAKQKTKERNVLPNVELLATNFFCSDCNPT